MYERRVPVAVWLALWVAGGVVAWLVAQIGQPARGVVVVVLLVSVVIGWPAARIVASILAYRATIRAQAGQTMRSEVRRLPLEHRPRREELRVEDLAQRGGGQRTV